MWLLDLSVKIDRVNGMVLCEVIPAVCICGGTKFEFEEDLIGTVASCVNCRRLYMGFEKHPELVRQK